MNSKLIFGASTANIVVLIIVYVIATKENSDQDSESNTDENHQRIDFEIVKVRKNPLYNPAFPRKTLPSRLLYWQPADHSHDHFQPINDEEGWIYSAFFDTAEDASEVRIFGISKVSLPRDVNCHFFDDQKRWMDSQEGKIIPLSERKNHVYLATSVVCPIDDDSHPKFVSVSYDESYWTSTNQLPVNYPGQPVRNFTVCYAPFHSNYDWTFQLLQAIEFNRLLGASHFEVYNFSISSRLDKLLLYYQEQGLVSIHQWPLPVLGPWYYGQLIAINDCIYRNRVTSKFVVVMDTDEFIIPTNHPDWWHLINEVIHSPSLRQKPPWIYKNRPITPNQIFGGFSFRHANHPFCILGNQTDEMLRLNFTGLEVSFLKNFPKSVLLQVKHSDILLKHEMRSKMIIRPEAVYFGGVHRMLRYKKPYSIAFVRNTAALLHHYRNFQSDKECKNLDTSVMKFKDKLFENLNNIILKFPSLFTTS